MKGEMPLSTITLVHVPLLLHVHGMPNFILSTTGEAVPVGRLSADDAERYATAMRDAFMAHWKALSTAGDKPPIGSASGSR